MSTTAHNTPKSITPQDIAAWLLTAKQRWAAVQRTAARGCQQDKQQETWTEVAALLQQAFEEIQVINEQLRERAQTVCDHSTQLREHSRTARAIRASSTPSPKEIAKAESRLLEMFRGGNRQEGQ